MVNISGFLYNNISLKKINTILHAVQTYIIYEEQIIALEKANCGRGRQKEELVMITYNRANQCTPYRSDMRKYHNSMFSFLSQWRSTYGRISRLFSYHIPAGNTEHFPTHNTV